MKDLRRLAAIVVVVSFSVAALMGIVALLGGGDFGSTEARILGTTVIAGVESIAVLCYLALAGHRLAIVGIAGAIASVAATVMALVMVWGDFDTDLWKEFGIAVTVAASLAQASLLIALAGRTRIGIGLIGTLLAIAVVGAMIVIPIANESDPGGGYWRIFGVVAILDVLGTVVLTAMGAFGRRVQEPPVGALPEASALLSDDVERRVIEAARERGVTPSRLVEDALDAYLSRR